MGKVEGIIVWSEAHSKTCLWPLFVRITLLLSGKIILTYTENPQYILKLELQFSGSCSYCFNFVKAWNKTLLNIINDSLDIWHLKKKQHSQQEQNSLCVCMCVCVLVLHLFMFHCSGGSEQDLCSKCKPKWNNFIIVLWTTISAIWGSNMKIVI